MTVRSPFHLGGTYVQVSPTLNELWSPTVSVSEIILTVDYLNTSCVGHVNIDRRETPQSTSLNLTRCIVSF